MGAAELIEMVQYLPIVVSRWFPGLFLLSAVTEQGRRAYMIGTDGLHCS